MIITARQVQFLLKESPDKAWMMVMQVRKHLDPSVNILGDKDVIKDPNVDVEEFDKYHKLEIKRAMEDIYNNALIRPAFKKYVLNDIPETALGQIFKDGKNPPKTIRLPAALRSLMSPGDLQKVSDYWYKNFQGQKYQNTINELRPTFKP